jgi:hypothetical protein
MTEDVDEIAALEADIDARLKAAMPQAYMQMVGARERHAGEPGYVLPPEPAPLPAPLKIEIDYRDARAACGTGSDVFNGEVLRQAIMACARPGQPDFDATSALVIAAMREIAPRNALEGLRASLAVAAHQSAMTAYKVARSCRAELAPVFLHRGDVAASLANALIEVIERGKGEGAQEVIVPPRRERRRAK